MLPAFNRHGLLPPGTYIVTQEEFEQRFVVFNTSDRRFRIYEGLKQLIADARRSGFVKRLFVVGSYATGKPEPSDFDCILVLDPALVATPLPPFQYTFTSPARCRKRYGGDVVPVLEGSLALQENLTFFSTDRDQRKRGIVEIVL